MESTYDLVGEESFKVNIFLLEPICINELTGHRQGCRFTRTWDVWNACAMKKVSRKDNVGMYVHIIHTSLPVGDLVRLLFTARKWGDSKSVQYI